jgi:predicted nucleic acid-binding Zn ribbon protein
MQTFAEAGSAVCPKCSGAGRRVYHAVPVIYKGSGFYTTDYGRPMRQTENGSKDASEGKSGSGDDAPSAKESKKASESSSSGGSEAKAESTAKTTTEAAASS